MRTALDTDVPSALWSAEPEASRIAAVLGDARALGGLVVCGPVFAELLAHPSATETFVENFLQETGILVAFELEDAVWRKAGTAFATYARRRRRSGGRSTKTIVGRFPDRVTRPATCRPPDDPGCEAI